MAMTRQGPDPIDVAVGARIRIRRRWLGFSQTQLANSLGITFQQVQKYERGANRVSASMLVKIAAKLETTVAALVGEDGQAPVEAIIYAQLATPGATELLAAYAQIADGEARRALLTITEGPGAGPQARRRLSAVSALSGAQATAQPNAEPSSSSAAFAKASMLAARSGLPVSSVNAISAGPATATQVCPAASP